MREGGNHIFRVTGENLSAISCDAVLRQFAQFVEGRRQDNIVLDLSGLTFVDPYGMGMLCLIARHLSRTFWDITCRMPDSEAVRSYLARMNVLATLGQFVSVEGEASSRPLKPPEGGTGTFHFCRQKLRSPRTTVRKGSGHSQCVRELRNSEIKK